MRVKHAQLLDRLSPRVLDRGCVTLRLWRAHEGTEQREQRGPQRGIGPVHPAVGLGARARIGRPQAARRVLGGEIAHDGVGLPDDEAVVVDRRHQPVGIELAEFGRIDDAIVPARVDALVRDACFLAAPQYLLHVDGIGVAPDLQHE